MSGDKLVPMLKHIDAMLQDCTEFHVRMLEGGTIGYPGRSAIAALMDYRARTNSRPAGCVVPFLRNIPEHVNRIDRVLRVLPDDLMEIVRCHYIARDHGESRRRHYQRLDRLSDGIQVVY